MSAGVRLGGGARTNLNTKPEVPFCMQVTLASLVSQYSTTSLPTGYSDEWELRTLMYMYSNYFLYSVGPLYYKPLKCGNLYNKDTILYPSLVL